jgi:multidrug efflux pump subunit AcrA (membrane-fusion protein)
MNTPILSIFIWLGLSLLASCKNETGIHPTVGTITESVYASGHVKAEEQYKVFSKVPGILIKRLVKVGDSVERGDSIFTIQNPVVSISIKNSELGLRRAEENLQKIKELKSRIEQLKNKFLQDSLMYVRQKKLWEQNVGTKVQLEQAELNKNSSKTDYLTALQDLKISTTGLKTDYETAKNNLNISKENAEDYVIRSETSGRVYTIYPEEGEGVTPQTVLAVIGKQDKFLIELQVDEDDISRVDLGQEIFVTMDSYKDSVFKARVSNIYPIMNEETSTFTVEGEFINRPSKVYPHLNLEANILIKSKKNAVIIPREFLLEGNYVLLKNKKKVKVNVGLKNFDYVEIVKGLSKDQLIYKP